MEFLMLHICYSALMKWILLCVFTAGYFRNVTNIDLNSVRLCFQVFLPDANKKFTHIVQPVVSQPIIDKSLFL